MRSHEHGPKSLIHQAKAISVLTAATLLLSGCAARKVDGTAATQQPITSGQSTHQSFITEPSQLPTRGTNVFPTMPEDTSVAMSLDDAYCAIAGVSSWRKNSPALKLDATVRNGAKLVDVSVDWGDTGGSAVNANSSDGTPTSLPLHLTFVDHTYTESGSWKIAARETFITQAGIVHVPCSGNPVFVAKK